MPGRIVVFGATGYTGRLTVERLVAAGVVPVLAGRDSGRLQRLAASLGPVPDVVEADVARPESVLGIVGPGDVLVSTVGPFAKWGEPAVRAAIGAPCPYIDSTGEPTFIRRVFEEFSPAAADAGVPLMTAMGYDWVPGQLAGALALREAGPDAVRVDVGYYAFGAGLDSGSKGTKASLVGASLDPGFAFRGGRLVTERPAARVRSFRVKGKDRPAVAVASTEHFTLPVAHPQLLEVNVYLGWAGSLARAVQAGSAVTAVATRVPGVRPLLRRAGEALVSRTRSPQPGQTSGGLSWVAAIAYDSTGAPLAEVHVSGGDAYEFTARFLGWAAREALAGSVAGAGAVGPVQAFGLEALERGCAEAGLSRTA